MWESASKAVAKVVLPLGLVLVALAVASSIPVYADVSFSFTARVVDENRSQARVLTISKDADTVSFGEEGVPLGEMRDEDAAEKEPESAEKSKKGVTRETFKLKSGPRVEIEKKKPGSINIQIGDEYYEEGKDIVKFGENVEIKAEEVIDGDVVVMGGTLTVFGKIGGDAVCLGGTLTVKPGGIIDGDAVSIGGTVVEEPGSSVKGDVVSMGDFIPGWVFKGPWPRYGIQFAGVTMLLVKTLIVLFIAWIIAMVGSQRIKVTADMITTKPFHSFGLGLLVFLLTPIAIVLLCITIIGIPVAILLPIALVVVGFFGYTAVGLALGRKLFTGTAGSVVKAAVIGVLLLEAVSLVGRVMCIPWGPLCIISIPIRIIGWAIIVCAISMGLGASILSKMGQPPKPPAAPWVRPPGAGGPGAPGGPGPAPAPGQPPAPGGPMPPQSPPPFTGPSQPGG